MMQKQGRRTLKTPTAHGNMSRPTVLVFAGPNGSGKSTITAQMPHYGVYINADDLKKNMDLPILKQRRKQKLLGISWLRKKPISHLKLFYPPSGICCCCRKQEKEAMKFNASMY
jgi:hypothetical protein